MKNNWAIDLFLLTVLFGVLWLYSYNQNKNNTHIIDKGYSQCTGSNDFANCAYPAAELVDKRQKYENYFMIATILCGISSLVAYLSMDREPRP